MQQRKGQATKTSLSLPATPPGECVPLRPSRHRARANALRDRGRHTIRIMYQEILTHSEYVGNWVHVLLCCKAIGTSQPKWMEPLTRISAAYVANHPPGATDERTSNARFAPVAWFTPVAPFAPVTLVGSLKIAFQEHQDVQLRGPPRRGATLAGTQPRPRLPRGYQGRSLCVDQFCVCVIALFRLDCDAVRAFLVSLRASILR